MQSVMSPLKTSKVSALPRRTTRTSSHMLRRQILLGMLPFLSLKKKNQIKFTHIQVYVLISNFTFFKPGPQISGDLDIQVQYSVCLIYPWILDQFGVASISKHLSPQTVICYRGQTTTLQRTSCPTLCKQRVGYFYVPQSYEP